MMSIGNGAGVSMTSTGPWRQHWSVLIGTFARGLVVAVTVCGMALYFDWPWLALLAPLGLIPTLMAYFRWQRRCLFLIPTDLVVESGVVTTQAVSFPIRDIDMIEARKTLFGKMFDYGDVAIYSGPQAQVFEKLYPFNSFMAAYQARRQFAAGWPELDGRWLPSPPRGRLPGPPPREPRRERTPVIEGRYRRLDYRAPSGGDRPSGWGAFLRLIALCLVISVVITLIIGF